MAVSASAGPAPGTAERTAPSPPWGRDRGGTGRRGRRQAGIERGPVRGVLRRSVGRGAGVGDRARRGATVLVAHAGRFGDTPGGREIVRPSGESDSGVGTPVESGTPAGVGDQLPHREVVRDVGQRSAARFASRSALGTDDRQVPGVLVGVLACQDRDIEDDRPSVAAHDVPATLLQHGGPALQRAGVGGAVLLQQTGGRFQRVDRGGDVPDMGSQQCCSAVRQAGEVEQQRIQRLRVVGDRRAGGAEGVQDLHDVAGGGAVGVAEGAHRVPVVPDRLGARIDLQQDLIGGGGGLPDPLALAAQAVREGTQDGVEFGRVDLLQEFGEIAEYRVDLGADVLGFDDGPGMQASRTRIVGIDEVDVLGAERGGGADLGLHIGRDLVGLIGEELQGQCHRAVGVRAGPHGLDAAHLDTAHLDLASGVHHQSGPVGGEGHRHEGPERSPEETEADEDQ